MSNISIFISLRFVTIGCELLYLSYSNSLLLRVIPQLSALARISTQKEENAPAPPLGLHHFLINLNKPFQSGHREGR